MRPSATALSVVTPRALSNRYWAAHLLFLIIAAASLLLFPARGSSQTGPDAADPAPSGALLLRDGSTGPLVEAVRLATDVSIDVTGAVQRATVTQAFRNTTNHWVEATYLYPLPQDGAVDSLRMVVGNRVIVGHIRPREEARRTYEAARDAGQRAGLVEQQRPNMFVTQVANIGPGESVLVQIEYQAPVRQSNGAYSLRVPLVVGPRYSSPNLPGPTQPETTSAPVLDPRTHAPINPVTITVRLNAGFPVGAISSPYHRIIVQPRGDEARTISLAGNVTPANRDFELNWAPAAGVITPNVRLFSEHVGDADYVMAFISPPTVRRTAPPPPREMIYVIDNSGSMDGESIRQAKASLLYALSRLRPGDRFNIIRFDDTLTSLFPGSVPADAAHIGQAQAFVSGLEAAGGTEMVPALRQALADTDAGDNRLLRQIVFLTDGEISDEQAMFAEIGSHLGRSRLFMVGIGSAPNTFLMTRMAELGRGAFTHIGDTAEVQARMRLLLDGLESPVATSLSASFSERGADIAPDVLPDLYAGEPVVISARVLSLSGALTLTGTFDGRPWRVLLPLNRAVQGHGLSKLWARRRIEDADVAASRTTITREVADARILALAMEHGLVSAQTSLVAVDETPARPAGTPLRREDLPLNFPAGWDFDAWFGGEHPRREHAGNAAGTQLAALDLPQTATDGQLWLLIGLGFTGAGCGVFWFGRRRPARTS